MSLLPKLLTRRPPRIVAIPAGDEPGPAFGVTALAEPIGWTVTAYGPDGRRLGRPLKGLSDPVYSTLVKTIDGVSGPAERERLADAWVEACRVGVTNAEVLTGFSDAALALAGGSTEL